MSQTLLRNLHLELVQGDDYKAVDGRTISIAGRGVCWPANIANVKLIAFEPQTDCGVCVDNAATPIAVMDIDGIYSATTTASAALATFDLPRAATLKLTTGVRRYQFEVRALLASESIATLAQGTITVLRSQL
jgi:hypothetical protein